MPATQTILTPDMITRESLRVLHQKCNFIGNINRQYDNSFAQEGAKIGNTLRIRRPVEYTTATGATMSTGTDTNITEQNFTLTVNTQRHVPMRFTTNELTMKLDDFSSRIIEPAMARMAAAMESDALSMVHNTYNNVYAGGTVNFANLMTGRKSLVDNLAPETDRTMILDTQAQVDTLDALKGLFQSSSNIRQQYREGMMGRTGSFDFYENTLLPPLVTGTSGGTAIYNIKANQSGADAASTSLVLDTGTKPIAKGQTFTIAGVNSVHPESKVDTGIPQQFTFNAAAATQTGDLTISVSPGLVISGPRQNVSAQAAAAAAVTMGGAASTTYKQSIAFHKDAFVFGTADLVMPNGVDFASRQVYDGISMRIVRDYDIVKDRLYCRVDVLYGYTPMYRQLACKILHT